jgi:hypothetical protein
MCVINPAGCNKRSALHLHIPATTFSVTKQAVQFTSFIAPYGIVIGTTGARKRKGGPQAARYY